MFLSSPKNVHTGKRDNTYFEAYRGVTAFAQRNFGHRQILEEGLAEDVITFIIMFRKPQGKVFAQIVQCVSDKTLKRNATKQCLVSGYKNNFFNRGHNFSALLCTQISLTAFHFLSYSSHNSSTPLQVRLLPAADFL
ncbi:hypothetical protein HW132_28330 [Brasilonema sp. CT11]|nr:hypothetical protein [Brasilonema sp. CT11]